MSCTRTRTPLRSILAGDGHVGLGEKNMASTSRSVLCSVVGISATVALGGPALYFTLQERTPSLKYEITSEANVFDLHKSLESLDIIFQGNNIRQAKQNLRIITLTVRNDGRTTILQNHFDSTEDWGFKIGSAELVDAPRIVDSNSDYLREKLHPSLVHINTVVFQKVIFERGKYISLELLLLHSAETPPTIQPIGKIAGIDNLLVTKRAPEHVASTFWGAVVQGSVWVHLSRVGLYLIVILLIILVFVGFGKISTARQWRRRQIERRKCEERFQQHFQDLFNDMTPPDKEFALAILNATGSITKILEEVRNVIYSEDTLRRLEEGERFLSNLTESPVGKMFSWAASISDAIFEKTPEGHYRVTERASRVIPAIADFLSHHPVPDGISRQYWHHRLTPYWGGVRFSHTHGADRSWQDIFMATQYAKQRYRRLRTKQQAD